MMTETRDFGPTLVPGGARPAALDGPDPVTALRVYGRSGEHYLPMMQRSFSIGSSGLCDIPIDSPYVSSTHCTLQRQFWRLWADDRGSRNGTFSRGHRVMRFCVVPGEVFSVATTRLLPCNDHMRLARPILYEVLGLDQDRVIDDVIVDAMSDGPLLIVGPKGARQRDLVRVLRAISSRRHQPLLDTTEPGLTSADQERLIATEHGTLILKATGEPFDKELLAKIEERGSRLILLAPSLRLAMRSLTLHRLAALTTIQVRPLSERRSDIRSLLEERFVARGAYIRVADLSAPLQRRLLSYDWPGNLDELDRIAAIIAAVHRHGSGRRASEALKMPRSTLQYWAERFGLPLPATRPRSPRFLS